MSSAVAELDAGLQAMLALKPPGVSGSRIQSITALCTANIQSESVLIQKLYTHFKKAPSTHKLGVLYVLDSVTRKWTEQAKNSGQPINSSAQDGTYAAGVHRVKELLPVLMNDIIQSAPGDQKEKIKKLVDIWEKGQTFPLQMLTDFKEKMSVPSQNESTTPPGSPPVNPLGLQRPSGSVAAAPAPNTSSILAALASMARQNQNQNTAPPPTNTNFQVQDNLYRVPNAQNNPAQQIAALNQTVPFPPIPPPVSVPALAATFAQQTQGPGNGAQNYASNQTNALAAIPPIVPPSSLDPAVAQQLLLIKRLTDAGVAPDQIPGVIAALDSQGAAMLGTAGIPPPPPQFSVQNQNQSLQNGQNGWGANGRQEESRDRNGYDREGMRSPGRNRHRSRSRSPPHAWDARDSPARRRDEVDFDYDRNSPGRNRNDRGRGVRGGRTNNDYRQRSPPRRGRSPTPPRYQNSGQKWVGYDTSIGKGNIKVLSRTLFVGGVTSSDHDLRSIFEKFGTVQTCIVNKEKRHAFVKMTSRAAAVAAKEGMEKNKSTDSQLRTKWGVGFGPRDCSDYQTGVSIIPVSKLTDADRKWMLTAEYGGSGGKPIEPYMVVEEPDIEIGQGVSSKAISRRMQTDQGGNNGPKSTRDRESEEASRHHRRGSRDERHDDNHRDDDRKDRFGATSGPPSMPPIPPFGIPGFPFNLPTLPNGMPMFPPGFVFPGQAPAQPPPPGHRS